MTRELAQANIAFGLSGLLALIPHWWPIAGFAGAAYLCFAFLGHLRNPGKNAQEQFALWTDAIVAVVVLVTSVYAVVAHAAL
ncbi:heme/copper-type cytochrome/quinol oxidase subunit 4 [Microbacterium terrae]|uniref:hypothetical protein n=1 Tax=Microbacterium terrae TaxID=69369 RepID=UPI0012EE7758|nr:hypothetical protein [Microbacterium terrae]MBP1076423.1 heme/copper-type cytochrome/quinol oxidase subunit 4 [Microbacterium terrae]